MITLASIAGLVVVALVVVWAISRSFEFYPDRSAPPPAAQLVPGAQDVTVTTADGLELAAWFVPPRCGATVLVAPGNGGNRAVRAPLVRALADEGLGVLLLEYRGYGGNPGSPSQAGLALDARAARATVLELAPGPLVYLGESLGTAVVTELASEYPPDGLVLRSPPTSLAAAADVAFPVPVGWLLRDRFPVVGPARSVAVPTAVVRGTGDTVVPPAQSVAVAEALRQGGSDVTEVAVDGANHNDGVLAAGPTLVDATLDVVARAGVTDCGTAD